MALSSDAIRYQELKDRQEASLRQHQQFSQRLEDKKASLEQRQGDLDMQKRLLQILDPTMPKPARVFLMNQLAGYVGVDPKSQSFRGIAQMITSLDPDALQGLRTSFTQQAQSAQPGELLEMTRGILSGQVPVDSMIGDMHAAAGTQTAEADTGYKSDATAKPGASGSGAGAVRTFEGSRTTPDDAKLASPQLVRALKLDNTQLWRNGDLIAQGYAIPLDAKDQEKLANEIQTSATSVSSTIRESSRIISLIRGRPEILGPVGNVVRSMQSTVRQVQGLFNLVGGPDAVDKELNPYDAGVKSWTEKARNRLADLYNMNIKNAEDAARVDAAVLGLAYRMAGAQNIPGNRLTNGIIEQQLRQIGSSASPEQFEAVLTDTLDGTIRTFDEGIRRQIGVSGNDIVVRHLTDQDMKEYAQAAATLPSDFRNSMRNEALRRRDGDGAGSTPKPSEPSIQQEQQTLGNLETERKQRELDKFDQERQIATDKENRAKTAEERAASREERMTDAQVRAQKLAEDRFNYEQRMRDKADVRAESREDRADAREDRALKSNEATQALQREKFEHEKSEDKLNRDQKSYDRIAEAFRAFGNAIAGSGGGSGSIGGGGGGGGQQDVGAFRLSPLPQRTPPQPPKVGQ